MLSDGFGVVFVVSRITVLICLKNVVTDPFHARDKYPLYLDLFLQSSFLVTDFFLLITSSVKFRLMMKQQEHHWCDWYRVRDQPLILDHAWSDVRVDKMNSSFSDAERMKNWEFLWLILHISNPNFGSMSPYFFSVISTSYSPTSELFFVTGTSSLSGS